MTRVLGVGSPGVELNSLQLLKGKVVLDLHRPVEPLPGRQILTEILQCGNELHPELDQNYLFVNKRQ